MRLEHRPDEKIRHQLPKEARTAGPNAQNLWGTKTPPTTKVWSWQMGPRWARKPQAVHVMAAVPAQVAKVQAGMQVESEAETTMMMMMILTNTGRRGMRASNH